MFDSFWAATAPGRYLSLSLVPWGGVALLFFILIGSVWTYRRYGAARTGTVGKMPSFIAVGAILVVFGSILIVTTRAEFRERRFVAAFQANGRRPVSDCWLVVPGSGRRIDVPAEKRPALGEALRAMGEPGLQGRRVPAPRLEVHVSWPGSPAYKILLGREAEQGPWQGRLLTEDQANSVPLGLFMRADELARWAAGVLSAGAAPASMDAL